MVCHKYTCTSEDTPPLSPVLPQLRELGLPLPASLDAALPSLPFATRADQQETDYQVTKQTLEAKK